MKGYLEMSTLEQEITLVLNANSAENGSNTPDHILAHYMLTCLAAFNIAVQRRDEWYGRNPHPTKSTVT